jgi:hypothetical protein
MSGEAAAASRLPFIVEIKSNYILYQQQHPTTTTTTTEKKPEENYVENAQQVINLSVKKNVLSH